MLAANKAVEYEFHDDDWSTISPLAKDWIKKALNPNSEKRFSPEEAKRHPWLHMFFPAKTLARNHSNHNQMPNISQHNIERKPTGNTQTVAPQPPQEVVEKSCIIC